MEDERPKSSIQRRLSELVKVRFIVMTVAFFGIVMDYVLRVNLSIAVVAMKEDLKWDSREQGLALSSFYWGYIFTQLSGGILAKKYGTKLVFGVGIGMTTVLTMLTPVMSRAGIWGMVLCRILQGVSEGVTLPAMSVLIVSWSPQQEKARLYSFVLSGTSIGIVVGLPFSGWLGSSFSWEWIFYGTAIPGVAWLVLWQITVYNCPTEHPHISEDERRYIMTHRELNSQVLSIPWGSMFRSVPFYANMSCFLGESWGWYTLMNELPTFMADILEFDLKKNSMLSTLPYVCFFLFSIIASAVTDYIRGEKILTNTAIRKIMNCIACVLPGLALIGVAYSGFNKTLAVTCFILGGLFNGARFSGYSGGLIDMAPNFAGILFGMATTLSTIPAFLSPLFVTYLTEGNNTMESWRIVFLTASFGYIFCNILFLIFGSAEIQSWNDPNQKSRQHTEVFRNTEDTETKF